jgi:AcrR family transcriptional regulator
MPKVVDEGAVFAATLEEFVRHGYAGARTARIAELAGVNEATLFRRYGTKAVLVQRATEAALADAPLAHVGYTGDLEADLLAIVTAYVRTYARHGNLVVTLLIELPRQPELRAVLEAPARNIGRLVATLDRYRADGELLAEPAQILLARLIGPLLATGLGAGVEGMSPPPLDASSHVRAFLEGNGAT